MRLLVLCYSFTGNNRLLARALSERLGATLEEVATVRRRNSFSILLDLLFRRQPRVRPLESDLASFDRVLLVAPLWDMHIAHPLAAVVRQNRGRLPPCDFATLCGYDREGQLEHVGREVEALTGRPPGQLKALHVGGLLPEADRTNVRKVSGHRVTPEELARFGPEMEEIAGWYPQAG